MNEILHARAEELTGKHTAAHEGYEVTKCPFVPRRPGGQCVVNLYRIPVGKAAYPYHYHLKNEEVFYILSGQGTLRTPQGERTVTAGELLFFPASAEGAHKLVNTGSEELVYLDFDTANELDVAMYPDSGKIGIWGKDVNRVFFEADAADYFAGE